MMMTTAPCSHTDQIRDVHPEKTSACNACVAADDTWVSLRMCLVCGNVGCCDSSEGRHAAKHFQETGHPIMKSVTPGEVFSWCYVDKTYI